MKVKSFLPWCNGEAGASRKPTFNRSWRRGTQGEAKALLKLIVIESHGRIQWYLRGTWNKQTWSLQRMVHREPVWVCASFLSMKFEKKKKKRMKFKERKKSNKINSHNLPILGKDCLAKVQGTKISLSRFSCWITCGPICMFELHAHTPAQFLWAYFSIVMCCITGTCLIFYLFLKRIHKSTEEKPMRLFKREKGKRIKST